MTIAGNLKTMALEDIMQWLTAGGYTGTLMVTNGQVEKSIYFREGRVISCTSNNPEEFLGHFLVGHGLIGERELAAAVSEQDRNRELLGKILVDQGAVSAEDLERMLVLKAEEAIYELFRWPGGQFEFAENVLPNYEMVPISLDVTGLMLEGMRRLDEWNRIRQLIPSAQCVPVAVADLIEGEQEDARRTVLELVDDDRSVEEICLHAHSAEYFVGEILFQKARDGKLKVVRPRLVQTAADEPTTSADALFGEARSLIEDRKYAHALRRLRAAGNLEPENGVLGKRIRAAMIEIRASIETDGVDPAGVPQLTTTPQELAVNSFSPAEGFILSRINGADDVGAIVKISPLPELDALLVFWKLLRAGHIQLQF